MNAPSIITITSTDERTGVVRTIQAAPRPLFSFAVSRDIRRAVQMYTDFESLAAQVAALAQAEPSAIADNPTLASLAPIITLYRTGALNETSLRELLESQSMTESDTNNEAAIELLRALVNRNHLSAEDRQLIDSPLDGEFWGGVDIRAVREQADVFFRALRRPRAAH